MSKLWDRWKAYRYARPLAIGRKSCNSRLKRILICPWWHPNGHWTQKDLDELAEKVKQQKKDLGW